MVNMRTYFQSHQIALLIHLKRPIPVHILIFSDVGVISPSILPWHCWYIANETHDDVNLRYQPDIRLLMSSWHRHDNRRYPAERNPPGSYAISVSAIIITCFYRGNWKIKASGNFFSVVTSWRHHVLMTSWECP